MPGGPALAAGPVSLAIGGGGGGTIPVKAENRMHSQEGAPLIVGSEHRRAKRNVRPQAMTTNGRQGGGLASVAVLLFGLHFFARTVLPPLENAQILPNSMNVQTALLRLCARTKGHSQANVENRRCRTFLD